MRICSRGLDLPRLCVTAGAGSKVSTHMQVAQLEEEVAVQKRAMDADLRERAAEAERLKAAVEELRNATSHDVADSEAAILGLQVLPCPACRLLGPVRQQ